MIGLKLAFTTLGCPNWDLDTIIAKAVEYGYDGVDFRGYLNELDIYKTPEFSTYIEDTRQKFQDASLKIPCFSSSVRLFTISEQDLENHLNELEQYAKLCRYFNTPYIRVFGGGIGEVDRTTAINIAIKNLQKMLKIAKDYNVELLIETHDDWTESKSIAAIINKVRSDHLSVLWDVHHPYRTVQEDPVDTLEKLAPWIHYTHWKDSYIKEDTERGYQLCLMGEGDVPLQQIYHLLSEKGYNGYLTLEWEKKWCPEIEEPEMAFRQFPRFMEELSLKTKNNNRGSV